MTPETPSDLVKEARDWLAATDILTVALKSVPSNDIITRLADALEALEASAPEARRRKLLDARLNKIMSLAGCLQAIIEGRRDDELGVTVPPLEASARPEGGAQSYVDHQQLYKDGVAPSVQAHSGHLDHTQRHPGPVVGISEGGAAAEYSPSTHSAPSPEPGGDVREAVAALILQSVWSPASGPVVWTDEKMAAAQAQASHLAAAILSHPSISKWQRWYESVDAVNRDWAKEAAKIREQADIWRTTQSTDRRNAAAKRMCELIEAISPEPLPSEEADVNREGE